MCEQLHFLLCACSLGLILTAVGEALHAELAFVLRCQGSRPFSYTAAGNRCDIPPLRAFFKGFSLPLPVVLGIALPPWQLRPRLRL